jgi:AbrB family looped-hinge helix DNA binding protein
MQKNLSTTKMSSRGQVVIPESVRIEMGLKPGSQFVVIWQGDVVMLKVITPPSFNEYAMLKKQLRKEARKAGLKRKDIPAAIAKVRGQI